MAKLTLDEKVDQILIDLASVKTNVRWLKSLYLVIFIPIIAIGSTAVATGMI